MELLANESFLGRTAAACEVSFSQEARRAGLGGCTAGGGGSWRCESGSSSELARASESGGRSAVELVQEDGLAGRGDGGREPALAGFALGGGLDAGAHHPRRPRSIGLSSAALSPHSAAPGWPAESAAASGDTAPASSDSRLQKSQALGRRCATAQAAGRQGECGAADSSACRKCKDYDSRTRRY